MQSNACTREHNNDTGEGLAWVLAGAEVVMDAPNAPSWEDTDVLEFFETSTRNLLVAEQAAWVRYHVALSVVGANRIPGSGYMWWSPIRGLATSARLWATSA